MTLPGKLWKTNYMYIDTDAWMQYCQSIESKVYYCSADVEKDNFTLFCFILLECQF